MHMKKDKHIHIRVTEEQKSKIESNAHIAGFTQVSDYLRVIGLMSSSFSIKAMKNGIGISTGGLLDMSIEGDFIMQSDIDCNDLSSGKNS